MKLDKELCKYKKQEIKSELDSFKELVLKPKFICPKCARVAISKKNLCKSEPLDS